MNRPAADVGGRSFATEVLDRVRDAVFVIDHADLIVYANPVGAHSFGGPEAVVGRTLFELIPGLAESRLSGDLQRVRSHGVVVTIDDHVSVLGGWYRIDIERVGDHVLMQVRETTEGRRNEIVARVVTHLGRELGDARRLVDALGRCADVLRDELSFDAAEVWTLDPLEGTLRRVHTSARPGLPAAAAFVDGAPTKLLAPSGSVGRAIVDRSLVATPSLRDDAASDWSTAACAAGLVSGVHLGVDLGSGRRVAFGLLRDRSLDIDDSVAILDRVTERLAGALTRHVARLDLEGFFDVTGEAIALIDFDGALRRVNPAFARYVGVDPDGLVNAQMADLFHPDDVADTVSRMADAVRRGVPAERIENRLRSADGTTRWMSWTAQAFRQERIIYASGRDITEERRERIYRETYNDVLHDVLAGHRLDDVFVSVCRLLETLHDGVRASMMLVEDGVLRPAAAGALPAEYLALIDGLPLGPSNGSCGTALFKKRPVFVADIHADPLWAEFREAAQLSGATACWSMPILDTVGEPLGTFALYLDEARTPTPIEVSSMSDAAHLARIAISHRRAADAEATSSERFRILSDVTTDAIFDIDLRTGVRWTSEGFRTLFGHDPAEMAEADDWWPSHVHPDDFLALWERRDRALLGQDPQWVDEFRYLRSDGSYAEVVVRAHIVRNTEGQPIRLVGGISDVTERRLLEQQYLRAQRVESLGTLAGGIAHDLNNSLAPIVMAVDLLQAGEIEPDLADTVDIIAASARRSADMVRQILTFARGIDGERVVLALPDVVHEAVQILRDAIPKNIAVDVGLSGSEAAVRGDSTQLHQVLVNLLLNARDSMPDGGRVSVTLDEVDVDEGPSTSGLDLRPGRYVRVHVADTGTGVAAVARDRIFEPFFTTKARAEGTGLGLPTALAISRSHGGGLTFWSEPGRGTTFTMALPVVDVAPEPALRHRDGEDPIDLRGRGATVLVVDDEPVVRAVVRESLRAAGYRVVTASDGQDALEMLDSIDGDLDVVLTDIMMAPMDGADLAGALRARGVAAPIVAMTGLDETQRSSLLARHGVSILLSKPFDRPTLLRAVRDAIDTWSERDAAIAYPPSARR